MAVGIIMMLFGGCGALNNVQKITAPKFLDDTSGILDEVTREMEEDFEKEKRSAIKDTLEDGTIVIDSSELKQIETVENMVSGMFNVSDYYKKWVFRFGIIGSIVAIIYFLAGLLMVMGKSYSLKFVYGALALSMASLIFQIIIFSMDKEGGMLSTFGNIGAFINIFVNIVLLVIVLASDKSYFDPIEEDFA